MRVLTHLGALDHISEQVPDIEWVPVPQEGPPPPAATGEVLLTLMRGAPNIGEVLDRGVRWVHTIGTGVDEFPLDAVGDRVLTCSRGANAVPIAEWVMAQILTAEKHLPDMWVSEPPDVWGMVELGGLEGRTLGIVGLGSIGVALARRALAFDMRVVATRRSAAPSPVPGVEVLTSVTELASRADHLVLAAPATAATRGLIDAAVLAALPAGAHLVNVARGDLVDDEALRAALDSAHLGLASIDVARHEPLPAGHWFYDHPRVRFSPHVSWSGPGVWEAMQQSFVDNLRRWRSGEPLANVVDLSEGY